MMQLLAKALVNKGFDVSTDDHGITAMRCGASYWIACSIYGKIKVHRQNQSSMAIVVLGSINDDMDEIAEKILVMNEAIQ